MSEFSLEELGLVDAQEEEVFDNLTQLASYITGTPVSLVSFVQTEKDRQYFKSQVGLSEPWRSKKQTPLSHSFCQYVVSQNTTLVVDNASEHPLVANNRAIPDLGVHAYLGVPIYGTDSTPLGALCVIESKPRQWDSEAIENLQKLAYCVSDAIRTKILYKQSENLRNEQQEFSYSISHDLKAPLTTLSYLINEIKECPETELSGDATQFVELANSTISRAGVLIEDVHKYASTLQNDFTQQSVDLNKLFQEIIDNLRGDIEQSGAIIDLHKLPVVMGSETQLTLLFQNIIHNAIKFRRADVQPQITITATRNEGRDEIRVSDNGIGISPEYHTKIFESFERLHTHQEYQGSGLGLTLAQRVASNHDGSIELESKPLEGTTFKVNLRGVAGHGTT